MQAVNSTTSFSARLSQQQHVHSMLQFLTDHGHHIDSIELGCQHGNRLIEPLRQLPHNQLQGLTGLSFSGLHLQLQPADGFEGVLWAAPRLKQLRLHHCFLLDWEEGLSAAMALLPELQHLTFDLTMVGPRRMHRRFPVNLQALPQLTRLQVFADTLDEPADLQQLQGLTHLQDLQLTIPTVRDHTIQVSMLSGMQHLSRLVLKGGVIEPGAFASNIQLQHLEVGYNIGGGSAGLAQLLAHLQSLQQLTHLSLNLPDWAERRSEEQGHIQLLAPPEAYSALTTSSKLQCLQVRKTIPASALKHIFLAGRLPELRTLQLCVRLPPGLATTATACKGWGSYLCDDSADFSLLSCCPGLHSLLLPALESAGLRFRVELLDPLLQLTHLKQLTRLSYGAKQRMWEEGDEESCHVKFCCEVSFQI
jgi:hypothetical protein